ncbi:periostin, osteoblast specific factor b isoform X2 [Scyliorhinus canicula]|uniref:periostin, osteoblast specific factor b isoform X2 n=1 Tax=Scyliorhinus canicula TaxID=7830 RepID=UPI0018F56CA0|nr:periostin, osteoblast specific factor b isoform X2 [Scyliorhinus canicula]
MKLLFLSTFSLFVLTSFDQAQSSYYDKIVTHSRIRAKDKGPNVCALQQVAGTKKKYFSTCRNWYRKSICGKKALVLYECCPGYMRLDGGRGCPAVAPIDHVYGTLGIVGARSTQNYAARSNLRKEIEGVGSFTFFAPSDDAWMLLNADIRDALLSNVNIELLNALHYHMVNYRLLTKDMKDGMSVPSMYSDLKILINHYPNGIVTVNCAKVLSANQIATNGIVHVIDRVITAVGNTIADVIEATDELSSLRAAATASGLLETLGKDGHYTVFAPTNEAFDSLSREVLERILSDPVALKAMLNYHILNSVQCSEAIMSGSTYATLEGTQIEIGCDGDSLTVNGQRMVNRKDIVTSNGVIHLIDKVLIPDAAMQVLELTNGKQTTFYDLVKETGVSAALTEENEYTLLAPMNDAFDADVMAYDQRLLKLILKNHILKLKVVLNELYNGQRLETLGGNFLRVFIYRTAVCIENSCMLRGSKEGRNGVIHMIRKVIIPSEKSLLQILRDDPRFSIFLTLAESAGLTELLTEGGDWTLFVPTNDVFESLSPNELEELTRDKNALRHILLYHLLKGVYVGGGIEYGVTNILKSFQGSRVMVKLVNNTMLVNNVKSKESDLMANNGVIHVVNSLLFPKDLPVGSDYLYRILTKIIKYIQFKFIPGYTYKEIRLPTIKTKVTEITRIVTTKPEIKVISGKVIQSGTIEGNAETFTKLIEGGGTHYTKVTRIIEGDPKILEDEEIQKLLQGGSSSSFTKITIDGEPLSEHEKEVTRLIHAEPSRRVAHGYRRMPAGRRARQTWRKFPIRRKPVRA